MEAATLSSPQRKLDVVVPVQKSLSLPSYARAGGEGIDHRIIFAALEQKEKIRRKSRIFSREKTARQNIFCLPISSGNKCRETSLSSDTSCSSLEYQKPKSALKAKKEEKQPPSETTTPNELTTAKTSQSEVKTNQNHKNVVNKPADVDHELQGFNSLKVEPHKGHRSPSDTLRPSVNSSDSMERSSRSSNDSLSRKERLVAIKAKVEAAREKYGESSSEDENRSAITRYNSDGVIHRTVREVKSRSYRLEKRLRRRSQDEYGLRKVNRRNNLSLCLNSLEDGIKIDFDKPLNILEDGQNMECRTDFCPSPNLLDFTKKNYFSDFPCKENMSRVVQARIRQIEEEERKRRNSPDFRDKTKHSSRQSPQNTAPSSPFSTQLRNAFSTQNASSSLEKEKNSPSSDVLHCPSPVGRAPTPPPRSPKSMTFVNKAYIQHQNTYLNHDSLSLERKSHFQPNIPVTLQSKHTDKANLQCGVTSSNSKINSDLFEDAAEKRKLRELFNSRRKTCGFFDYADNYSFKELNSTANKTPASKYLGSEANSNALHPKPTDISQSLSRSFSGSDTPPAISDDPKKRLLKSKWEDTEKRHEFMFNSLESKKKFMSPWIKWSSTSKQNEQCLCQIISGNKYCTCSKDKNYIGKKLSESSSVSNKSDDSPKSANDAHQSFRLSKSEVNISSSEQTKINIQNANSDNLLRNLQPVQSKKLSEKVENNEQAEKLSFAANLDSAMAELESVYRSLKFSSDNLSEKNSESNFSLNDLNAETPKKGDFNHKKNHDFPSKSISSKEHNFNLYNNKPSYTKPAEDKKPLEFLKLSVYSPTSESVTKPICKSPETENLCIDEMFNDLTRQLDIEQKLLKESRDNRSENRPSDLQNRNDNRTYDNQNLIDGKTYDNQSDKYNIRDQKRMTPLESIVSIRKELYDNLQKSSQEYTRSCSTVSKTFDKTQNSQLDIAKKKHKAVRSLSENISYLMATSPNSVAKPSTKKTEHQSYDMNSSTTEKLSASHYERVAKPFKLETKKETTFSQPVVPKRTCLLDKQKKPVVEEIRQIRVSMDPNSPEATIIKRQYSEYPRLTSAVCRSQVSPKNETTSYLRPSSSSPTIPKETADVLDENGLEKLLNTLLNDVPESKQSSRLQSMDDAEGTPPPAASAGEMRVMQHLDILRLKPIPS